MENYNIHSENTLHLVLRLRGDNVYTPTLLYASLTSPVNDSAALSTSAVWLFFVFFVCLYRSHDHCDGLRSMVLIPCSTWIYLLCVFSRSCCDQAAPTALPGVPPSSLTSISQSPADVNVHWPQHLSERHIHASLLWCSKNETLEFFVGVAPAVWQAPVLTPTCCHAIIARMISIQPFAEWANATIFPPSSSAASTLGLTEFCSGLIEGFLAPCLSQMYPDIIASGFFEILSVLRPFCVHVMALTAG